MPEKMRKRRTLARVRAAGCAESTAPDLKVLGLLGGLGVERAGAAPPAKTGLGGVAGSPTALRAGATGPAFPLCPLPCFGLKRFAADGALFATTGGRPGRPAGSSPR